MRQLTRLFLVCALVATALSGCDKGDEGGETPGTGAAQPGDYYEAAQVPPQVVAERNLRGMFDRTLAYFSEYRTTADGDSEHMLPGPAPLTPATVPCGEGVAVNPEDWNHPTWRALRFTPSDPLYYSYQYDSAGTGEGARFQIAAFGDLDCDGVLSTFIRGATGQRDGEMAGDTEARVTNRDE